MAFITTAISPVLSLYASKAMAWSYTRYYSPSTHPINKTPKYHEVQPFGSVSATQTDVTTGQYNQYGGFLDNEVTMNVTVTNIYLASGSASACKTGEPCTAAGTTTNSEEIDTSIYAPIVVTNEPSCTLTSYSYTTSGAGMPGPVTSDLFDWIYDIWDQATDRWPEGPTLAVSTYDVTLRAKLGGQAVTTKRCDIFLKPGQLNGLEIDDNQMSECVDPRLFDFY
ncbi:hypothetical protein N657DRAFT_461375 [Parathielavia appendiculata]|uniref:Uncharacterized protein n=1 Tax=Parathielavia appendiculata TaxID=2587402 RepID=A0AAN6TYZ9_9PEZI|nr:hypothetical protein N657DRAFT_461375 [Parathielavia appendiculata]